MRSKDRNLVIIVVIICLSIAVMAPFIASKDPDGLEKTTEQIPTNEVSVSYQAPFTDYAVPFLGSGPYSGIAALAIGVLLVLGLGYLAAMIFKRRNPPEVS
jgi:cobalt/nickel transport protein